MRVNLASTCLREIRARALGVAVLGLVLLHAGAFAALAPADAAAPGPEKWLPDDTLAFLSAPSLQGARAMFERTPQGRMWSDPAVRAFREKLLAGWRKDVLEPIERELSLEAKTFADLLGGQATVALIQDTSKSGAEMGPTLLLVADSGTRSQRLKKELSQLQARWFAQAKGVRNVRIQDHDFVALSLQTNAPLGRLRLFMPRTLETQELGSRPEAKRSAARELFIGQAGSLVLISTSQRNLEQVLLRLTGGAAPVLGDQAAYRDSQKLFDSAPVYGWMNAKAFLGEYAKPITREGSTPPPPSPVDVLDKGKFVRATGLGALRAVAFAMHDSAEGLRSEMFFHALESDRQGLLKLFSGEAKPCDIPAFVPADVAEFQRWRIDGQRAWSILEKAMTEVSPQWLSTINFIIETANQAAQQDEPGFDVRKNLLGNLGDDIITYSRAPAPGSAPDSTSASLWLVASPNPAQLAASLRRVLIFMTAEAEKPREREFLGRTVYSIPLPAVPLPFGDETIRPAGEALHYTATSTYVVVSTDVSLLEEHLRSATSQASGLRELSGVKAAAQAVVGQGTRVFAYESYTLLQRLEMDKLRAAGRNTNSTPGFSFLAVAGVIAPEKGPGDWLDYKLLPPWESLSKYFYLGVRGVKSDAAGITISWFDPTPPALRREVVR